MKEVTLSPIRKMIKLQTFDNLFPRLHYDIFAKIHSRMSTVIAFSRPNDVGSHAHTKGLCYNLQYNVVSRYICWSIYVYQSYLLSFSLQKEQLESELVEKSQIIDTMSEQLSQYRTGMLNKSDEEKLFEELQANYDLLETGNSKLRQDLYMTMKEKEHLRLKLRKDYDQIVASLKLELEQSREQNLEKERFIHNQRVEIQSLVGDKDSLIAKLKEKSGVTNEDLQRSGDVEPNVDEVTELKNEINLLRKECQDCRMEKDKLFNKFHETAESLRSELEKSFDEKANLAQKSEEALNQSRELQQSLLEKQSALTKAKLQFEHIGKGWRNDLEAARAEKEELLRRLGSQVNERVSKNVSMEKSALLEFYTSGVNLIKLLQV